MSTDKSTSEQFPEQNAPRKNTDDAFVKVGEDGSPVIPSTTTGNETKEENEPANADEETTLGIP